MTSPADIVAYYTAPADTFCPDWNWADAATEAWLIAARATEHTVEVISYEVKDTRTEAALVRDGEQGAYILTVHDGDGEEKEVRAQAVELSYVDHDVASPKFGGWEYEKIGNA